MLPTMDNSCNIKYKYKINIQIWPTWIRIDTDSFPRTGWFNLWRYMKTWADITALTTGKQPFQSMRMLKYRQDDARCTWRVYYDSIPTPTTNEQHCMRTTFTARHGFTLKYDGTQTATARRRKFARKHIPIAKRQRDEMMPLQWQS